MPAIARTCGWVPRLAGTGERLLFCLPYAGGGAHVYRSWPAVLDGTEVVALRPPGRESRFREPAFTAMEPLVDDLLMDIDPYLDRPFAFFGHSMGAQIAYAATRRLLESGRPHPDLLIVSGSRPPHVARREPVHERGEAEFLAYLRGLGGLPPQFLASEELVSMMLPVLRADFSVVATQAPESPVRLPVPIHVLTGSRDDAVPLADAAAWADVTGSGFSVQVVEGDHFFVDSNRDRVLDLVRRLLHGTGRLGRSEHPRTLER